MATEIYQPNDREIYVNDKLVRCDMDGQWIAKIELTQAENEALQMHLNPKSTPIV